MMGAKGSDGLKRTRVAALIALAVLAACNDPPTRPSAPPSTQPAPVVVTRLEIVGPDSIQPGESVQYSAIGHQSDGTTRDLTNEASWQATPPTVLTISSTGRATGLDRGEGFLSASAGARGSSKNVMVLPAGTYRLTGNVRDAGHAVGGARVEINGGIGRGLASTTDSLGAYRIYGVAGDIEVRVNRSGFQELRRTLLIASHQTVDFDLVLSRPRAEVAGTYVLTVSAGPECRAVLPEAALVRRYTAVVTQDGPRLAVTLGGSKFYTTNGESHNRFLGAVEPGSITFQIGAYSYYYPTWYEVLEELDSSTFLAMVGGVVSTFSEGRISGVFYGSLEMLGPGAGGNLRTSLVCHSTAHRFEFSR